MLSSSINGQDTTYFDPSGYEFERNIFSLVTEIGGGFHSTDERYFEYTHGNIVGQIAVGLESELLFFDDTYSNTSSKYPSGTSLTSRITLSKFSYTPGKIPSYATYAVGLKKQTYYSNIFCNFSVSKLLTYGLGKDWLTAMEFGFESNTLPIFFRYYFNEKIILAGVRINLSNIEQWTIPYQEGD